MAKMNIVNINSLFRILFVCSFLVVLIIEDIYCMEEIVFSDLNSPRGEAEFVDIPLTETEIAAKKKSSHGILSKICTLISHRKTIILFGLFTILCILFVLISIVMYKMLVLNLIRNACNEASERNYYGCININESTASTVMIIDAEDTKIELCAHVEKIPNNINFQQSQKVIESFEMEMQKAIWREIKREVFDPILFSEKKNNLYPNAEKINREIAAAVFNLYKENDENMVQYIKYANVVLKRQG